MRLLLFLLLLPTTLHAGAWARGDGQMFAAVGLEGTGDGATLTFFAERGFGERLTFGVDGYIDEANESLTALAFARYTFRTDGPHVWAISGAIGGEYRIDFRQQQFTDGGPILTVDHPRAGAFVRIGGHYGRGLENGWLAADLSYDVGTLTSREEPPLPDVDIRRAKLDLTYGHRLTDEVTLTGQLFLQHFDGEPGQTAQLGAAYAFSFGTAQLAVSQGLGDGGATALKLGLWRSF